MTGHKDAYRHGTGGGGKCIRSTFRAISEDASKRDSPAFKASVKFSVNTLSSEFIFIYSIYSCLYTITYQQIFEKKITITYRFKEIKLLFQGVALASLYLKSSLNLTLKKLNEAKSCLCFGISVQVLAPWYPEDFLQYSRGKQGISKSLILLVFYLEIFDIIVNLFLKFSGQSPFVTLYEVISLSNFMRLHTLSQSHTKPSLCSFFMYQ